MEILIALIVFLQLFIWVIFAHVILSWLTLFGLNIQVPFINNILDPIYKAIENTIPTSIGWLSFTPIVVLILIMFIKGFVYIMFPDLPYLVPETFR